MVRETQGARDYEDEAVLLKVADAFDAVEQRGRLSKNQLGIVVDGVSHSRTLVWSNACDLLKALTHRFEEAAEAILEMLKSRKAHVRFNALCCLGRETPHAVTIAALRLGLSDRSAKVRWKAADQAMALRTVELIPEMTAALKVEQNAKTRSTIESELRLLRDGYILEQHKERYCVSVSYQGGVVGTFVSEEELRSRGIEAIVLEIRRTREAKSW